MDMSLMKARVIRSVFRPQKNLKALGHYRIGE